MKHLRVAFVAAACVIVTFGVVIGAYLFANHYLTAQEAEANAKFASCTKRGASHVITIKGDVAAPDQVTAPLCDTLTITNADDVIRLIAFGPHENHQSYDGITEQAISQNGSVKVLLNQAGTFHWHDHIHDEVQGDFMVTR
jgi:hypothetical protein